VVEYYERRSKEHADPLPVFFYCQRQTDEQTKAQQILASILRQLCTIIRDIPGPLAQKHRREEEIAFPSGPLDVGEIIQHFLSISHELPQPRLMLIIMDGLDELDIDEQDILLEALTTLMQDAQCLVKILVSSRQTPSFRDEGYEYLELKIEPRFIKLDIDAFVREEGRRYVKARSRFWRGTAPIQDEVEKVVNQTIEEGWDT
jgi:hypothetical protein